MRTTVASSTSPGAASICRPRLPGAAFVDALFETDWVVYAKPAFGGASAVLRYLGRYTHRVAISNHRLLAFDGEHVTFPYKDYAHGDQRRTMTLTAMEFLRRFVQHILPRGFVRIRPVGLSRERLPGHPHRPRPDLPRHAGRAGAHLRRHHARGTGDPDPRDMGLSPLRSRDDRRADPLGAPARDPDLALRHVMSLRPPSLPVAVDHVDAHVSGERVSPPVNRALRTARARRTHRPSGRYHRRSRAGGHARHAGSRPGIPHSSSIAGRRASGFLQVSLSKVSRHRHRGARPASRAETPPMNANDFSRVTLTANGYHSVRL